MIVLGIDNGLDGAIVALDAQTGAVRDWVDVPTMRTGKGTRRDFVPRLMVEALREHAPFPASTRAYLEHAQAMPAKLHGRTQGVSSSFRTGEGFGIWRGILAAMGYPYELVRPAAWMRAMVGGPRNEGKQRAVVAAEQLFPGLELFGPRGGAKHGRADAALIAEYGRRKLNGAL